MITSSIHAIGIRKNKLDWSSYDFDNAIQALWYSVKIKVLMCKV
ncbi:hypothetical protein EBME_0659 [bacterium endosymbiont of Mortierella elongata FMR23-6]|nr:hypothetical protein EBME_0659 [bacterium endosymbiont of Mortierella elongata FMR23-6]